MFIRLLAALLLCLALPSAGVFPAAGAAIQAECAPAKIQPMDCCTAMACCQMNSGTRANVTSFPLSAPPASVDLKFTPVALKLIALLPPLEIREHSPSHPLADLAPHAPSPLARSGIILI